ncbi:hypothetical protein H4R18_000277 [Coemansia javaensis]|uniref:Peptidase S1 domain-containing protein n=1 Tax=Coemansia javaensis TaxID=2761396 RepID=A0A9W8LM09_9FUNG|nr:hypothetical protein H4R18_000277 [Coemansia javaensis]
MKAVALLGLAALAAAGAVPRNATAAEAQPRIIGGRPATSSEFQSTVFLYMYDGVSSGGNVCTGSLIAPNVVLTANHCLYKEGSSGLYERYVAADFTVTTGHAAPDLSAGITGGYSVSQVIGHPGFTMTNLKNDLALLILSRPVPSTIPPIKIYQGSYTTKTPIRAAGFGVIDPVDTSALPTQLMVVDLALGSSSFCASIRTKYYPGTQVCTDGTGGVDTCVGDSGGPLATPYKGDYALLGLTSFGLGNVCAMSGNPGYYTYIAPFLDWIAQNANLNVKDIAVGTPSSSDSDNSDDDDTTTTTSRSRSRTSTSRSSRPTGVGSDDDDDGGFSGIPGLSIDFSAIFGGGHGGDDKEHSGAGAVRAGIVAAVGAAAALLF